MGIKPRPGSPDWLVEEVQRTQHGLMRLRQNVVLLRDPADSNHFYPVCCLSVSKLQVLNQLALLDTPVMPATLGRGTTTRNFDFAATAMAETSNSSSAPANAPD